MACKPLFITQCWEPSNVAKHFRCVRNRKVIYTNSQYLCGNLLSIGSIYKGGWDSEALAMLA